MQLMRRLQQIFRESRLNIFFRPYEIFITSSNSGMIEFIPDTISIDSLKKKFPKRAGQKAWTLKTFYEKYFGSYFEEA
jgi:phosphatidylinositol kinase/protein kinase (PI-3  family)